MKKLISILFVFVLTQSISFAQDNRTFETRVVDILTEMPATNLDILNKQMSELVSLGEKGILKFAEMLTAPDIGGDTKARFVLGNLSKFTSSGRNDEDRLMVSKAYLKALDKQKDDEIKAFLIKQIQLVGKDEAVSQLETYLSNERLCGVAAMALTAIGSVEAGKVLYKALPGLKGNNQVQVVKAIGELKFAPAENDISQLTGSNNTNLTKVSLYYLANLPTSKYGKILESAAKDAGYTYKETRANASYLLYAERLAQEGQLSKSEKICKKLIKEAPEHTAGEALSLLVKNNSALSNKYLLKALSSDNKKYRETALRLATTMPGKENTELWIKELDNSPANIQAEIITMLGNRGDISASAAILNYLNSKETAIQLAAIRSLAKLDPETAVKPFIALFPLANEETLGYLGQTMLWMKTDKVIPSVAKAIPQNSGTSKIALIEILAVKKSTEFKEVIYSETSASDDDVRLAALKALAPVSEKSDRQRVFDLFEATSEAEELKAIQNTLLAIAVQLETSMEKSSFMRASENLNADKAALFLEILPDLGGEEALNTVIKKLKSENHTLAISAFKALSKWKGLDATPMLFEIATNKTHEGLPEEAAMAYLQQVNKSDAPGAQKLLLIRKIIGISESVDIQRTAIGSIGKIQSISALIFVKNYLDATALQQDASIAVMNIALPGNGNKNGLSGEIAKASLKRAMQEIEGPESDYDKAKIQKYLDEMSDELGFVSVFNGKDLTGWKGLVENPIARAKMSEKELAKKQKKANEEMTKFWSVKDGILWFNGKGHNLCTEKPYGDFEMLVDWRISKNGDSGLYLRGTPQVQVWDPTSDKPGPKVGSGGLYNNKKYRSTPLVVADNPIDDWNTFHVIMIGEKVTVYLNGQLVVDEVALENYWDRSQPIFAVEQIELQAHGDELGFRDIYIKEIPRSAKNQLTEEEVSSGFAQLFNGKNLDHWVGNKTDYLVEDGDLVIYPDQGGHGNLFTAKEYADFNFRFEFKLTPGANNGLGIRAPLEGDGAYAGIELQILDNTADIYKDLKAYQYHGSAYGIIPAKRGYLKPVGEWNEEEVILRGSHVKIILNGTVILDGDMKEASRNGALDGQEHPGLERDKGHIGFLGHGSVVRFRNIRIKEL